MKNKLRNLWLVFSIALICFALVGCGGSGSSHSSKQTASIDVVVMPELDPIDTRAAISPESEIYVQVFNPDGTTVGSPKLAKFDEESLDFKTKTDELEIRDYIVKAFNGKTNLDKGIALLTSLLAAGEVDTSTILTLNNETTARTIIYEARNENKKSKESMDVFNPALSIVLTPKDKEKHSCITYLKNVAGIEFEEYINKTLAVEKIEALSKQIDEEIKNPSKK